MVSYVTRQFWPGLDTKKSRIIILLDRFTIYITSGPLAGYCLMGFHGRRMGYFWNDFWNDEYAEMKK